jgi:hypothetical protein
MGLTDAQIRTKVEGANGRTARGTDYLGKKAARDSGPILMNLLSDVDVGILVSPEISTPRLWRLEDQWLVQWPEPIDLRVLNFAPLSFRYEVTARGQRVWAADLTTVADMESLIWRQYWDFRPKLEQDWEHYVEHIFVISPYKS